MIVAYYVTWNEADTVAKQLTAESAWVEALTIDGVNLYAVYAL